ncbi:MAG: hypothetical protein WBM69_13560 [Desulfobacterales bacterium]
MGRFDIEEAEIEEDDQIIDKGYRRFAKRDADQPRRSPIRRKDRSRQEEGMKPKVKRNLKKIQHKIKYDWQGE